MLVILSLGGPLDLFRVDVSRTSFEMFNYELMRNSVLLLSPKPLDPLIDELPWTGHIKG